MLKFVSHNLILSSRINMDFTTTDIIPIQSPTATPQGKYVGASTTKPATITVQLVVAKISSSELWPLGTLVRNSFPAKNFLDHGKEFPNDLGRLDAYCKILYPDKQRLSVREVNFSDKILEEFSLEDITRMSWLGITVSTFVTHQEPEKVIEAYELIQGLDGLVISNPLDQKVKVNIRKEAHYFAPPSDLPILKYLVKTITENSARAVETSSSSSSSSVNYAVEKEEAFASTFVMVGSKRKNCGDAGAANDKKKVKK